MGTRHLTCVKLGPNLHGQYGQWDGYPEGAGARVLSFLGIFDEATFRKHFGAAKFLSDEEVKRRWADAGATSEWVNMEVASELKRRHPQLSRDYGSDVLGYIALTPEPELHDQHGFAADSLFCEWAWLVDLDRRELRCFKGFNTKPLPPDDFFAHLPVDEDSLTRDGERYHPVRQVAAWSFDKLPTESEFLAAFRSDEDDEEAA